MHPRHHVWVSAFAALVTVGAWACSLLAPSRDDFVGGVDDASAEDGGAEAAGMGVCVDASLYTFDHVGTAERLGSVVDGTITNLAVDRASLYSADPLKGVGARRPKVVDAGFQIASIHDVFRVAVTDGGAYWLSASDAGPSVYVASTGTTGGYLDASAIDHTDAGQANAFAIPPGDFPIVWSVADTVYRRAADGSVFPTGAVGVSALAADANELFIVQTDRIRRLPLTVGPPGPDVTSLDARTMPSARIGWLALDTSYVYFAVKSTPCARDGAVYRVARTGGSPSPIVVGVALSEQLALDTRFVYFTTGVSVMRASLDGTSLSVLVDGLSGCQLGVAVDEQYVYWSCSEVISGVTKASVWRAPKGA